MSAGLLMYRFEDQDLRVFLAHPGGPFFARKDEGAWSIPKGLLRPGEDPLAAAQREFEEETGIKPTGPFLPLGSVKQRSQKTVYAWAFRGDVDPQRPICSNAFAIEWPPGSGMKQTHPEIDRACFFPLEEAERKINHAQRVFLKRLPEALAHQDPSATGYR